MHEKYYLTMEGLEKIKSEYNRLLELRRSKTKNEEIPQTWHSEDVNPEYLAYQEDLDHLDRKISEHEHVLKNVEIVKAPDRTEREVVCIGSTVSVEIDGMINEFSIVGTLEADPMAGKISNESPVGRALVGKKPGDEVEVSSPITTIYKVKCVRWDDK